MSRNPIFIHSLFRTGSTYAWSKFRQHEKYRCYYEPFNQFLAEINPGKPYIWAYDNDSTDKVRHPRITKDHLFEYRQLFQPNQKGVPFFKKSFGFDDYCNNSSNPDLKKYIDNLINVAAEEGKTPVLQFNRTAFRIKWFKKYFPGSTNIYLVRNPRDQWQSYISMREDNNLDIFLIMDLLAAGLNRNNAWFKDLAPYIYLLEYHSDKFHDEESVYRTLLDVYSYEELYLIFYYTWLAALWEGAFNADILLSIDLLGEDKSYYKQIIASLKEHDIEGIDFTDAKPRHYREYKLETGKMNEIEEMVHAIISRNHRLEERNDFLGKLSKKEKNFFNLNRQSFTKKNTGKLKIKTKDDVIIKLENIHKKIFDLYVIKESKPGRIGKGNHRKNKVISQKDEQINAQRRNNSERDTRIKELNLEILKLDNELRQTKQHLQKVKNSYSYKLGKFVLFPLRTIKKIIKKKTKNENINRYPMFPKGRLPG